MILAARVALFTHAAHHYAHVKTEKPAKRIVYLKLLASSPDALALFTIALQTIIVLCCSGRSELSNDTRHALAWNTTTSS